MQNLEGQVGPPRQSAHEVASVGNLSGISGIIVI